MVIVAHPDDADFGPAGTMARWIDAGTVGHLICCTSGDAGADDHAIDPLVLAATREAEQRAAAGIIGYEGVTFLHAPDGALANDLALREQLVAAIREFRPDAVLTMDPSMLPAVPGGSSTRTTARRPWRRSTPCTRRRATRWPSPTWAPCRPGAPHGPLAVPVLDG